MTTRALLLLCGLVPALASAQRAPRAPITPTVRPALTVDLAAAVDERWRLFVEPITIGRVSLGVSATWSTRGDADGGVAYPTYAEPARPNVCTPESCGGTSLPYFPYREDTEYRASSLNVHVRWYPQQLSRRTPTGTVSFYVGEFLGYHQRRITTSSYFGGPMPLASWPVLPSPIDSGRAMPYPGPVGGSRWTTRLRGWEPGLELGVRGGLGRRFVLDLGASTRIVTLDDPRSARRPGQLDSRLAIGLGVAW
jgi:hypothetical protein